MKQAAISEKRAIERDNAIQKNLFANKSGYPKQLEILRMEVRLGNRTKIKSLFQKLDIGTNMEFVALFNQAIAKKVLLHFWDSIKQDMPFLAISRFKPEEIMQAMIAETEGRMKPAKLLQRLGALTLIGSIGLPGTKALITRHSTGRTAQRLKKELESMNLPTGLKFAATRHIDISLAQFQPLKMDGLTQSSLYSGAS